MRGPPGPSGSGPSPPRRRRWRTAGPVGALFLLATLCSPPASAAAASHRAGSRPHRHRHAAAPGRAWVRRLERRTARAPGYLQPGSQPSVLPGPVLIADRSNNRLLLVSPKGQLLWQFPGDGRLAPGQTFEVPDDAFFTPGGKGIIATEEDDDVVTEISLPAGRITYRYGRPGVPGSAPGYLDHPDDAMVLPGGDVVSADIKNCRIIVLPPGGRAPSRIYGETTTYCAHDPPARFGSPNGAFPLLDGDFLVTEINGDWVDEMSPTGQVLWSAHPPGFTYPSDTNEVRPGVYVSVDYTDPGGLETFTAAGQLLWAYAPRTPGGALDQPSLALPLPNGDFLLNDDHNDRVIVVDPRTDRIVWQYGHTGVPGSGPGYLDQPDGVDLAPPHSLLMTHGAAMAVPAPSPQHP